MVMAYKIKPPEMLKQLAAGDRLTGDLVVIETDPRDDSAVPQYWLENVKVTGHGQPPAAAPNASTPRMAKRLRALLVANDIGSGDFIDDTVRA